MYNIIKYTRVAKMPQNGFDRDKSLGRMHTNAYPMTHGAPDCQSTPRSTKFLKRRIQASSFT